MLLPLTKKEKLILEFIRVYTEIHGLAPSLYEIKDHFQLSAVSTVHEHLNNLKRKGYLERELNQTRSMKVIDTILADQQIIEIPVTLALNQNSVLVEMNGKLPNIYFHRNQLGIQGKYIALRFDNDLYTDFAILKGDYLVFLEATNYDEGQEILACVNEKFYYLGKLLHHKTDRIFAKYDQYQSVVKNFEPKGKLIGLFRDLHSKK